MKKLLAVLLSLCLFLGCTAQAQTGVQFNADLTYLGDTIADIAAQFGLDEDGCFQVNLDGNIRDSLIDLFAQIGGNSLVVGSGEEVYEITTDNLLQALTSTARNILGEDTFSMLGTAFTYYTQGGYEADKPILSAIANNEVQRLGMLLFAGGIISQAEDGTVTIDCDEARFADLINSYLGSLSGDEAVFAQLASTQLWSICGLSEGGAAERAALADASVSLPEDVHFRLQAVIAPAGTIDCDFTYTDSTAALTMKAVFDGNTLEINGVLAAEDGTPVTFRATLGNTGTGSAITLSVSNDLIKIEYEYTITFADDTLVVNVSNKTVDNDGMTRTQTQTTKISEDSFYEEVTQEFVLEKYSVNQKNHYICSADRENGMYVSIETSTPDSEMSGEFYAKPVQTEAGPGFKANLSVKNGETELNDIFDLEVISGETLTITSVCNGIGNDDVMYPVYQLAASFDPATADLEGNLVLEQGSFDITGSMGEDSVYTLVLSTQGAEFAKATLAVDQRMGFGYSLLMGEMHIYLYNGTEIARTAEMQEDGIEWTFAVTSGEQTQVYKLSINAGQEEDGTYYITLCLGNGNMSYVAKGTYLETQETLDTGLRLTMEANGSESEIFNLKLTGEILHTPLAHVSGVEIPAEQLEAILQSVLQNGH